MRFGCWLVVGLIGLCGGAGWVSTALGASGQPARSGRGPLYAPHHPYEAASPRRPPPRGRPEPVPAATAPAPKDARADSDTGAGFTGPATPAAAAGQVTTSRIGPSLSGPDLPLSAEQQSQLAELLKRYRADEITPEEYHRERARILQGRGGSNP